MNEGSDCKKKESANNKSNYGSFHDCCLIFFGSFFVPFFAGRFYSHFCVAFAPRGSVIKKKITKKKLRLVGAKNSVEQSFCAHISVRNEGLNIEEAFATPIYRRKKNGRYRKKKKFKKWKD